MDQTRAAKKRKESRWEFTGKNYLVVIAIDKYQYFPELNNAIRDAKNVVETLTQLYQFEEGYITEYFDEKATEAKIYKLFEDLVQKVSAEDNLIIFFSGHGYFNPILNSGYWIPVDGKPDVTADYISNADILNAISQLNVHHLLLFVDSCFSGSLVSKLRSTKSNSEQFPSRRVFASGRTEVVDDGIPGQNSPFAKGILNFLRYNKDYSVDTTSLIQHVKNHVEENSRQTPVDGRVRNAGDDNGEFIFHKKITEEELWERAREQPTIKSYEEYRDVFPQGKYADIARSEISKLEEGRVWEQVQLNGTVDDYRNYLRAHPQGEYANAARQTIEDKQAKIKAHQDWLNLEARKDREREKLRNNYKKIVDIAETLFASKDYKKAHLQYWNSLEYYIDNPTFVPDREYIEKQIKKCNDILLREEFERDGKRAFNNQNWELAIQWLTKALEIAPQINAVELNKLVEASNKYLTNPPSEPKLQEPKSPKSNERPGSITVSPRGVERGLGEGRQVETKRNQIRVKPRRNKKKASITIKTKPQVGVSVEQRRFERHRTDWRNRKKQQRMKLLDRVVLFIVIVCIMAFFILQLT